MLAAPLNNNTVVDCYSKEPIDKSTLLAVMHEKFDLQFEISVGVLGVNATGNKPHYYSKNRRSADFGYVPTMSSIEAIVFESSRLLGSIAKQN